MTSETERPPHSRPLDGIRVLDLSRVLAGPWSTQILADFGAEVIKIERPGKGDDTRTWAPPFAEGSGGSKESAYFLGTNRGKRSIEIDIKHPGAAGLLHELVKKSDVLVENFKVGDLQRSRLDYDSLHEVHPGLVYCSITGFGQSGPDAQRAGYDLMVQGMAGLMSITGEPDSAPGGGPMKVGVAIVDVLTGLYATIGILAALHERRRTGVGRYLDLALYDVCVASLANQAMSYLVNGTVPERMGNRHPSICPYQTFAVADGFIIVAVGNDTQFQRLCKLLGIEGLASDARFATNPARVANREVLEAILNPVFANRPRSHWLAVMEAAGVPGGPINDLREAFAEPHARARGIAREITHEQLGPVPAVANPIRFDGESLTATRAAPALGQDNYHVLRTVLGLSDIEVADLIDAGVVGMPGSSAGPAPPDSG